MDFSGEGLWRSFVLISIIFLNLPKYGVASYYEAPLPYRQYALNATDLPCGSEVEVKEGEKYLFDSASAIVYESSLYASQSYSTRRKRATKQDQKQSSKSISNTQDGPSSTKFKILQGRSQPQARGYGHGGGAGSGGYGSGQGGQGHYAGGDYGYPIKPSVCQWTYFAGEDCSLEMHIIRFKPGDLNCYKQEFSVSDNHTEFKLCGYQKLYPGFRAETPVLYIKYWKLPYTYRHVFKGYVTCVGRSQNPTYDDSHQYYSPAEAVEVEEVEAIEVNQDVAQHEFAQTLDEFMAQEGLSVKKASEDAQDLENAEEEINFDEEETNAAVNDQERSLEDKIKGHNSHQQLVGASEINDKVEKDVTGQQAVVHGHADSLGNQKKGVATHTRKETLEDKIKKFERQNSERQQRSRGVAANLNEDVAIVELVQEEPVDVDQAEAETESKTVDDILQQVDKHAARQPVVIKDEAVNSENVLGVEDDLGEIVASVVVDDLVTVGDVEEVEVEKDVQQVKFDKSVIKKQKQTQRGTASEIQRLGLGSRTYEDAEVDSYYVLDPMNPNGYVVPQPQQYGYSYPTVMYSPGSTDPYYSPVPAAYPYSIPTNEAPVNPTYSLYGNYPQPIPMPAGPVEPSYNYNVPVQQPPINPGMLPPYVQNGPPDYSQYSQPPVQPPFPYEYQPNPPQPQGYQGPMPVPYEPANGYGYPPPQYPPVSDSQYGNMGGGAPQYQIPIDQGSYYSTPPNEGPTYTYSSPSAQGPVLYPQQQAPEYPPVPSPLPPPPPYPVQYPAPAPSPVPPQLGYDYLMAAANDPSLNYIVSCDLPYPQPCTPLSITPVNVYSPQAHPPLPTSYNSQTQSQPVTYG